MKKNIMLLTALVAVLALLAGVVVLAEHSESSDAVTISKTATVSVSYGQSLDVNVGMAMGGDSPGWLKYGYLGKLCTEDGSKLPTGLSISTVAGGPGAMNSYGEIHIKGNYGSPGDVYTILMIPTSTAQNDFYYYSINFVLKDPPVTMYNVTYIASPGLINGSSTLTESIANGSHPSCPAAKYSDDSKTFVGWATTSTATSSNVTSSWVVSGAVTFYAVFITNSAGINNFSWTSTLSIGNSDSVTFVTTPTNATLSLVSGPSWVTLSGKTLYATVPTGCAPGSYSVSIKASATGWNSFTHIFTIKVPAYFVPPVEYSQAVGEDFKFTPETNPTNASITLTAVKFNGKAVSGFSVVGRTITGILSSENGVGTYDFSFTVSASSYASSTYTFRVYAGPAKVDPPLPSLSGIETNVRYDQARTYDFIAQGAAGYDSILWTFNGQVFMSASTTAVMTFPTAGQYVVRCTVANSAGSFYKEVSVVAKESYHPELAWAGVQYGYVYEASATADVTAVPWLASSSVPGYKLLSGTPGVGDVGNTYSLTVGGKLMSIKVYAAEIVAPIPDFTYELSKDQMTITVTFCGSHASIVYWDYGDGSDLTTSTTHTYTDSSVYDVRCIAVNNISERSCTYGVASGGAEGEQPGIDVVNLADITRIKGEAVSIPISLAPGDLVNINGTAAKWLAVDYVKDAAGVLTSAVISGGTKDIDAGKYDLGVIVTHLDNSQSVGHCFITITVADEPRGIPLWEIVLGGLIILLLFVAIARGGRSRR